MGIRVTRHVGERSPASRFAAPSIKPASATRSAPRNGHRPAAAHNERFLLGRVRPAHWQRVLHAFVVEEEHPVLRAVLPDRSTRTRGHATDGTAASLGQFALDHRSRAHLCQDNAVAEAWFSTLAWEPSRHRIFATREAAAREIALSSPGPIRASPYAVGHRRLTRTPPRAQGSAVRPTPAVTNKGPAEIPGPGRSLTSGLPKYSLPHID